MNFKNCIKNSILLFILFSSLATISKEKQLATNTEKFSLSIFQNQSQAIIVKVKPEKYRKSLESKIVTPEKLVARRIDFSEAFKQVKGTLTKEERKKLILYGSLADLRQEGECWAIESFGNGMTSEIAGYIDVKSGKLVFLWLIPEG